MDQDKLSIKTYESENEKTSRMAFFEHFKNCPIPDEQVLSNLGLFLNSKTLSRILFTNHLYQQIVDVQGIIMEFGTRWGQNVSLFSAFRGIYEPFNRHRKIVAFDTFTGFPTIAAQDGSSEMMKAGELTVTENYQEYLEKILQFQESDDPLAHIKKHDIYAGDATQTIHKFFEDSPESIIALAYFDFDLYEPTKQCLEAIRPRLVKGSILGFDELNDPDSPGETLAVMDVFGLNNVRLKRFPYASRVSYFVME